MNKNETILNAVDIYSDNTEKQNIKYPNWSLTAAEWDGLQYVFKQKNIRFTGLFGSVSALEAVTIYDENTPPVLASDITKTDITRTDSDYIAGLLGKLLSQLLQITTTLVIQLPREALIEIWKWIVWGVSCDEDGIAVLCIKYEILDKHFETWHEFLDYLNANSIGPY